MKPMDFRHITKSQFLDSLRHRDREMLDVGRIHNMGVRAVLLMERREHFGLVPMVVDRLHRDMGKITLEASFLDDNLQPTLTGVCLDIDDGIATITDQATIRTTAREGVEIDSIHISLMGDETDLELDLLRFNELDITELEREQVPARIAPRAPLALTR